MKVELFTSGHCPACQQAEDRLNEALAMLEEGSRLDVHRHLLPDEIDRAIALGVKALPALAIDNRLVITGVPEKGQLLQWLSG